MIYLILITTLNHYTSKNSNTDEISMIETTSVVYYKLNKTTMRTEILATIDELNQYLNGNVTDEGLADALKELLNKLQTK